jgi:hypothetical protein
MKIKLIGILVCLMLVGTFLTVAQPPESASNPNPSNQQKTTTSSVDVPVWEVGDSWTYQIDTISINYTNGESLIYADFTAGALPLTVTDVAGEFYTLSFDTTMSGYVSVYLITGSGPVNFSITFTDISLSGTVSIEKSTLGVKDIAISFTKQKFVVDIYEQHAITLPAFLQHINAKVTMNATIDCTTPVSLLSFPLNIPSLWNMPATNISLNGKVDSGWFHLIKFINDIAAIFNYTLIPPEYAKLLPVIDIPDALDTLGYPSVFAIPTIEDAFYCLNTTTITVPAGTYEAYNISIFGGTASGYYAPSVGNIVKLSGDFQYFPPINMELIATNYR